MMMGAAEPTQGAAALTFPALAGVLAATLAPAAVFSVEGNRAGTSGTPLAVPLLFHLCAAAISPGAAVCLHALLSIPFGVFLATGRGVGPGIAARLAKGLLGGFAAPVVALALERTSTLGVPALTTASAAAPAIAGAHHAAAWLVSILRQPPPRAGPPPQLYNTSDLPALKRIYLSHATVLAVHHLLAILSLPPLAALSTAARLVSIPALLSTTYTLCDARCRGYISPRRALAASARLLAAHVCLSSGAAWMLLWAWRDDLLASLGRLAV
jgi:hypothetical protein